MVDSRAKGARGEYLVRDMLRTHTKLKFERVPASGALEYLKGDLYVPQPRTNNLIRWWNKLLAQAEQGDQKPLLFFKYNRSPVFVCTQIMPKNTDHYIVVRFLHIYVMLAEEWLKTEKVVFTHEF